MTNLENQYLCYQLFKRDTPIDWGKEWYKYINYHYHYDYMILADVLPRLFSLSLCLPQSFLSLKKIKMFLLLCKKGEKSTLVLKRQTISFVYERKFLFYKMNHSVNPIYIYIQHKNNQAYKNIYIYKRKINRELQRVIID